MICVPYHVQKSLLEGAGKGLFTAATIHAGSIMVAPDQIHQTLTLAELETDEYAALAHSSIRWFEDVCTVSPAWPDECYVNHSFQPTGLWHLGFIFALDDLPPDTEITVDYRHLLAPGYTMDFVDALSGREITGLAWPEALLLSSQQLAQLTEHAMARSSNIQVAPTDSKKRLQR